ncbi:MAG TPA: 23S rRNA methyltransferase, partial [Gammaproteobacteria bacterium]|nr:23S rRNA methyltransferase [Gammaproteobacteria bacterium]
MSSKRASRTRNWAERQRKDPYVQKAREGAFRSRAAFKLQQLDQKERLLRPGMSVVDLGAAPGSWSQYAACRVGPTGVVVALDRLEMREIPGVHQIIGDFFDQRIIEELRQTLGERPVDLVICDLAPNLTGVSTIDQTAMERLVLAAVEFSQQHL